MTHLEMSSTWRTLGSAAILSLCLMGCGADSGPTNPTTEELVGRGWSLFESGDLAGARAAFSRVVLKEPENAEGWNGYGWALLRQGALDSALVCLQAAELRGTPRPAEPMVGQAILYRALMPFAFDLGRGAAQLGLARDRDFVFVHDATLNARDLRVIQAECLFGNGAYLEAKAQVDTLGGRPLDVNAPTFVQDLLLEIERARRLEGQQ